MAKKTVKTEDIKEAALGNILSVLQNKNEFDEKTQLAMKYLNYENRQDHLSQSKVKLRFSMVKSLANPEIMRKYVMSSEPAIKKLPSS